MSIKSTLLHVMLQNNVKTKIFWETEEASWLSEPWMINPVFYLLVS